MSGVALGITSAAISLGGSIASFIQAGQRKKDIREAEAAANAAMEEARKRTEVNYMEQLGIQKDAYRQAYETNMVTSKALSDAAIEGDQRGGGATASRILAGSLDQADKVRAAQEGEMVARQQAIAQEGSRLRDVNIQLDLEEVAGAQQAMADAELARGMAIQEGISGLSDAAMAGAETVPLYMKKRGAKNIKAGKYSDKMVEVPGLTGSDKVTFNPTGTNRPTIETQSNTMNVDPNMSSSPMNKMNTISLKSNPSFDDVIKGEAQIKDYQKFVLSKAGSDYLGPQGADGIVGPKSRKAGTSPTLNSWEIYGPDYLKYLEKNR